MQTYEHALFEQNGKYVTTVTTASAAPKLIVYAAKYYILEAGRYVQVTLEMGTVKKAAAS